jgi:hypothetical protein
LTAIGSVGPGRGDAVVAGRERLGRSFGASSSGRIVGAAGAIRHPVGSSPGSTAAGGAIFSPRTSARSGATMMWRPTRSASALT